VSRRDRVLELVSELAAVMDLANAQAAILVSVAILLTASAVARFAVPVQGGSRA